MVFFVVDDAVTPKSNTRSWNKGTDIRSETIKVENHGSLGLTFEAAHLDPGEAPKDLDINVL